jgi:hypothetical protein
MTKHTIITKRDSGEVRHEVELRPCPFCGSEALLELEDTQGGWIISCNAEVEECNVYVVSGPFPTAAEAAELWNHRA